MNVLGHSIGDLITVRRCECGHEWAGGNVKYCPSGHAYRFKEERYVPASRLAGAVDAERERVTAAIDQIERDEYLNGLRCRDFKEALDAVRDALGGQ
jgi:hypothetical protein